MSLVIWLTAVISFVSASGLTWGLLYGYRVWRSNSRAKLYLISPSSGTIREEYVKPPEGKRYVTVGDQDIVLEGGYDYNKNRWLVDEDTGKVMRIPPEEEGDTPIERLNGKVLNQVRKDERMLQWHTYQSGAFEALAKWAIPALIVIGLTVIGTLFVVLQGFGYMGN